MHHHWHWTRVSFSLHEAYLVEVLVGEDDLVGAHLLVQLLVIGQVAHAPRQEDPHALRGAPVRRLVDHVALHMPFSQRSFQTRVEKEEA
jgi:hypothetical protein